MTGSTGFVGHNILLKLKDFKYTLYDRADKPLISNNNCVLHLAGKAHDLKVASKPDEYYEANFELTKKLYDAFLNSDAQKFIFMSSVKASADEVHGDLTEDDSANPQTHYGNSKRMAEEYILANLPNDKQVYILRPCMIHGPGNKGNLNLLYKVVKFGLPWPLAAFHNQRSFLSIDNLCFVINELLIRNDIPSGVYNIADSNTISTNQLIEIISEELGNKKSLWAINKKLIVSVAKLGDKLHLPLNSERLKKLTESYVVNNQKLLTAINKSLPVDAIDGIKKTISSFEKNNN